MATHFHDYNSSTGRFTACGQYYENGKAMPRGVAISADTKAVSCQKCLRTDLLKKARAARQLQEGK